MITAGYQALRESAAWIDLSARGRILLTGEDRARLLHALTTNHIQEMKPGDVRYAFFLSAQGRILADVNIVCREEDFLLDVEPEIRELVYKHLDHYIIADDVQLEDITESTTCIGIEGPEAMQYATADAVPLSITGEPGFRVYEDSSLKTKLPQASEEDVRTVRLEHGKPRYGDEITATTLPQETNLPQALHFQKGCYLGQEIVERIRSRGHVNKVLVPFQSEAEVSKGDTVPEGEVVSAVFSPALQKTVGLAWSRPAKSPAPR
jgi:folate-binding protein YgfZ